MTFHHPNEDRLVQILETLLQLQLHAHTITVEFNDLN